MRVNRGTKKKGRVEGVGNLKRVDGGFINQHGVSFTADEREALRRAVNTANRKRKRMLEQEGNVDLRVFGKPTGTKVAERQSMGYESDFILAPKSKSMQRFKTRAEFENYLANVRRVNERGYIDERTEQYRKNYITGLERAFGDEADDIKAKINAMSPKEYREVVASADDVLEIGYYYLASRRTEKLNAIRAALGLDGVPIPDDDEYLDLKRRVKRRK